MSDALLARLRTIAGSDAVRQRTDSVAGSVADGAVVVYAGSPDVAAAVLAFCSDEGIRTRPAGAMTRAEPPTASPASPASAASAAPAAPRVILSTVRLTGTTEYNPGDLVVGTLAGTSLGALEDILRAQGQTLPLDPPARPGATIGAAAVLNAAGPLRAGHGTPRDMVAGLELVTGDGRLLRFGGRVVKNVAGYDLVRLVVGSRGVLGLVTSLHLRVRGAPEGDVTLRLPAADEAAAGGLALAIRDTLAADSLEVLGPGALGPGVRAGASTAGGAGAGGGPEAPAEAGAWTVLVRLRGAGAALAEARERAARLAGGPAPAVEEPAGVWERLSTVEASASFHARITASPADLVALLRACHGFVQSMSRSGNDLDHSAGWRVAVHATAGMARIWLPDGAAVPARDAFGAAWSELGETVASNGWTWRYEIVPPALREVMPPDSRPDPQAALLMETIRRSFDPAGILGPASFAVAAK